MKNNTIFFLTIPLYGHVFPVLDVINKVGKEGYNTYCFVNDFFAEYIKNDNVSVICYPEKVIANFNTKSSNLLEDEHISYYHLNYTSNNIEWSAISSKYLYEYMYDYMMKYVKKYNPQVIIYDSLAKWGGLLAKKFNIHSIAIEVATDIEEANCFYEKFYNEVVLEEIRLDEEQGKIKKNELLEINNWNEFLEYYDKVQMYVYRKFKTLMNFNERKILPDKLFVYSTRNLYESYSNHMKNVEFCGYDSNILSQLDLKEKSGAYVTRGTSIDYYSQNILRNILSEIKSMDINIDITVGNDKKVMERLSAEYEHVRNIHFYNFVDQWKMLANHEIFISHGGLSGVREAILCETPMIVYPSNYHDYQVGLAIERNNIGIMIKDRKLSHGNTYKLNYKEYQIVAQKISKKNSENQSMGKKMDLIWGDPIDHLLNDDIDHGKFTQISANGDILISAYIPIAIGNIKKHKFSEYVNKNWEEVWNHRLFAYLRNKMVSPEKMNLGGIEGMPELGYGKILFDILEPEWSQEMDKFYLKLISEERKNER